jgi:biotin operon repressor
MSAASEITEFQTRFLAKLEKCANGIESTTYLADKLGTSRVAVVSAGRALERAGLVMSFRSDNSQWASLKWAVRR